MDTQTILGVVIAVAIIGFFAWKMTRKTDSTSTTGGSSKPETPLESQEK